MYMRMMGSRKSVPISRKPWVDGEDAVCRSPIAGLVVLEDIVKGERAERNLLAADRFAIEARHFHRKLSIISR